jgi:hypothetical protein
MVIQTVSRHRNQAQPIGMLPQATASPSFEKNSDRRGQSLLQ